jgi:hypothetical protein
LLFEAEPFKPGRSGNPLVGQRVRFKLSDSFQNALADDFDTSREGWRRVHQL